METNIGEVWKIIPSFPDYEASTLGRVKSNLTSKILKFHNNAGYMTSHLYRDKKRYPVKLHRLVAETFLDNPENKEFVNHKNSVRDDNRLENLRWLCPNCHSQTPTFKIGNKKGKTKPSLNPKSNNI